MPLQTLINVKYVLTDLAFVLTLPLASWGKRADQLSRAAFREEGAWSGMAGGELRADLKETFT